MSSRPVLLALRNRKCDKWNQNNARALAFQQVLRYSFYIHIMSWNQVHANTQQIAKWCSSVNPMLLLSMQPRSQVNTFVLTANTGAACRSHAGYISSLDTRVSIYSLDSLALFQKWCLVLSSIYEIIWYSNDSNINRFCLTSNGFSWQVSYPFC